MFYIHIYKNFVEIKFKTRKFGDEKFGDDFLSVLYDMIRPNEMQYT